MSLGNTLFWIFLCVSAMLFKLCLSNSDLANIAVCISGQPSRFLPKLLMPFFEKNPDFKFDLFYNFQNSSDIIFSIDYKKTSSPTPYVKYNTPRLMQLEIENIYIQKLGQR